MSNVANKARPNDRNTTEVRGGATGHNVRYVLGLGIAGVVIAFVVIALIFGM